MASKKVKTMSAFFQRMQEASAVESLIEFKALATALEQFVQNSEEVEEEARELKADGRPMSEIGLSADFLEQLAAARKMQERVTEVFCALAE